MKVVISNIWYSQKMGYADSNLAKALVRCGLDVHVVVPNVNPYYNSPEFTEIYSNFLGEPYTEVGISMVDGYTLHRLPMTTFLGKPYPQHLIRTIYHIAPDVVQVFHTSTMMTYMIALFQPILKYKLFTEAHIHASVFFPYVSFDTFKNRVGWLFRKLAGGYVSWRSEACFTVADDCAQIEHDYFGLQFEKAVHSPLGVDMTTFNVDYVKSDVDCMRYSFGIPSDSILSVYSGRFTEDKDPLCLAKAIDYIAGLEESPSHYALFIGAGTQQEAIEACRNCIVTSFVSPTKLAQYYQMADIGVWPAQESTSQLDAMACGLPIVINNQVLTQERWYGNGKIFEKGDCNSLASVLLQLQDANLRENMSKVGREKIQKNYSWLGIAKSRIRDYYIGTI